MGDLEKFLGNEGIERLGHINKTDTEAMEEEYTNEEVEYACNEINKNSATATDGCTARLLLEIKKINPELIMKCIRECILGRLEGSKLMERLLVFIPKKTEREDYKKFRPIALMSQINKLAAHLVNNRLIGALTRAGTFPSNMHAYLCNRSAHDLVRKIKDDIQYVMMVNRNKVEPMDAFILNADVQGAFDHSSRNMIYAILKRLGFGETFIQCVKNLHKNITIRTCYNGKLKNDFKVNAGLGQGDPLSATLYILLPLILVIRIENDNGITAIDHKHKHISTGRSFTIKRAKIGSFSDDSQI